MPLILVALVLVAGGLAYSNYLNSKHELSATQPTSSPVVAAKVVSPGKTAAPLPEETSSPSPSASPTASPTGTASGVFSGAGGAYPAGQDEVYVGVQVPVANTSRVEYYVNSDQSSPYAVCTDPYAGIFNSPIGLCQLNWNWRRDGFQPGRYRWVVRVYDKAGNWRYALAIDHVTPYLEIQVGQ
jgi:hypothetical protein